MHRPWNDPRVAALAEIARYEDRAFDPDGTMRERVFRCEVSATSLPGWSTPQRVVLPRLLEWIYDGVEPDFQELLAQLIAVEFGASGDLDGEPLSGAGFADVLPWVLLATCGLGDRASTERWAQRLDDLLVEQRTLALDSRLGSPRSWRSRCWHGAVYLELSRRRLALTYGLPIAPFIDELAACVEADPAVLAEVRTLSSLEGNTTGVEFVRTARARDFPMDAVFSHVQGRGVIPRRSLCSLVEWSLLQSRLMHGFVDSSVALTLLREDWVSDPLAAWVPWSAYDLHAPAGWPCLQQLADLDAEHPQRRLAQVVAQLDSPGSDAVPLPFMRVGSTDVMFRHAMEASDVSQPYGYEAARGTPWGAMLYIGSARSGPHIWASMRLQRGPRVPRQNWIVLSDSPEFPHAEALPSAESVAGRWDSLLPVVVNRLREAVDEWNRRERDTPVARPPPPSVRSFAWPGDWTLHHRDVTYLRVGSSAFQVRVPVPMPAEYDDEELQLVVTVGAADTVDVRVVGCLMGVPELTIDGAPPLEAALATSELEGRRAARARAWVLSRMAKLGASGEFETARFGDLSMRCYRVSSDEAVLVDERVFGSGRERGWELVVAAVDREGKPIGMELLGSCGELAYHGLEDVGEQWLTICEEVAEDGDPDSAALEPGAWDLEPDVWEIDASRRRFTLRFFPPLADGEHLALTFDADGNWGELTRSP